MREITRTTDSFKFSKPMRWACAAGAGRQMTMRAGQAFPDDVVEDGAHAAPGPSAIDTSGIRRICAGFAMATFSEPVAHDVQTPPCFTQKVHEHARAGIATGPGDQSRAKVMFLQ